MKMTIALSSMVLGMGLFTGCAAQKEETVSVPVPKHQIKEINKLVYEDFKIYENKDGQIRGEKTEGTGEGIYLDKTYHGYEDVKDVEVGDIIRVTWNEDDYNNEIWDNIVNAEEVVE